MGRSLGQFFALPGMSPASRLLEKMIGSTQPIHETALHETLGRPIGGIHHLALRGLQFEDGRHTLETTASALGEYYDELRTGPMPSIRGAFTEWAPKGTIGKVGLPEDPYVFTSLCHVAELSAESQRILLKLRPLLLDDVPSHEDFTIPWLTYDEYRVLFDDSQYCAWFVTNTFLVRPQKRDAINHVAYVLNDGTSSELTTCAAMNTFLAEKGWQLNKYNGVDIQSVQDGDYVFRQSSVVATPIHVRFQGDDEPRAIPGIFHEFVEHPLTHPFRGFSNAQALFSSTSRVQSSQQTVSQPTVTASA